ncbi:MAG: flagellar motor protein PomA [Bdellovibrionales bacterium]
MDLATVIGLIGGFAIVVAAMMFGGSIILFINVPSILIVIGGSIFVVMMKFNLHQTVGAVKVALKAFLFKVESVEEFITQALEMSNIARKDGPLALESFEINNPFLKRGVQMVVDGTDPDIVKTILTKEKNQTIARHDDGQRFFEQLEVVAPAMGMIGTLIGLVQMLANMSDPKSIGPAMAVALLTTLYGAVIANMFAAPVKDKLSVRSGEEEMLKTMMIDVVYAIGKGQSKAVVEELLSSYLPVSDRNFSDEDEAA